MPNQQTHEQFVAKAILVHGENRHKYLSEFNGYRNKIKIQCLQCENIFEQLAYNHISGKSCQLCGAEKRTQSRKMT